MDKLIYRCHFLIFALPLFFLIACASSSTATGRVEVCPAFPNLEFDKPLYISCPHDGTDRLFVIEQDGRVLWFENKTETAQAHLAMDLSLKIRREHMEEGLLGMAFHPRLVENQLVFLHYSASNPRRNVLSKFLMNKERTRIQPKTEKIILEVPQPYGNHNGGSIEFGPDGFLYISLGDGGAAGDPHDNAQNKGSLLGKILRIDVDRTENGKRYGIPPDNPFVGQKNARAEIWAWGLRNVWKFSFDRETGQLWAGDVGQVGREEIDLIEKGKNYGWNRREGRYPYRPELSDNSPYQEPVTDHGREEAQSITGGYVYRGKQLNDLFGHYMYGDFITGNIWSLNVASPTDSTPVRIAKGSLIASFGEDISGELYFASFDGKIYRLSQPSN